MASDAIVVTDDELAWLCSNVEVAPPAWAVWGGLRTPDPDVGRRSLADRGALVDGEPPELLMAAVTVLAGPDVLATVQTDERLRAVAVLGSVAVVAERVGRVACSIELVDAPDPLTLVVDAMDLGATDASAEPLRISRAAVDALTSGDETGDTADLAISSAPVVRGTVHVLHHPEPGIAAGGTLEWLSADDRAWIVDDSDGGDDVTLTPAGRAAIVDVLGTYFPAPRPPAGSVR